MKSIHLFNFPRSLVTPNIDVMHKMDIVREICSASSSIRKRFNLRTRLPLAKLTIIGENALDLEEYRKFILEEANVKKIILDPNFTKEAELKLDISFSKLGKKLGSKMPEITKSVKARQWKKLLNGSILVGDEILSPEDFTLELVPISMGNNYESIGSDYLIALEVEVSEELLLEGLARDFVRVVQNERKLKGFAITDKINLFHTSDSNFAKLIKTHKDYIKEQCLVESIIESESDHNFIYPELEDINILIKLVKI